ncbi:MAG: VOC family protein [Pseudomonadota bacterium]
MTKCIKPDDIGWVSAYIMVQDVDKAVDFYQKAFGFTLREKAPGDDGSTWHASMLYQDNTIMFGKMGAWGSKTQPPVVSGVDSAMNLYVYVPDIDSFYHQALENGAKSIIAPEDAFWGDRMASLQDLDGYQWVFATAAEDQLS